MTPVTLDSIQAPLPLLKPADDVSTPDTPQLVVPIQSKEIQRIIISAVTQEELNPHDRIALLEIIKISPLEKVSAYFRTFEQILSTASAEIDRIGKEQIECQHDEEYDFELSHEISLKQEELKEKLDREKQKFTHLNKMWRKHVKQLAIYSCKLVIAPSEEVLRSLNVAHKKLLKITDRKFFPHLPFLTFMLRHWDKKHLESYLGKMKEMFPLLTYSVVSTHVISFFDEKNSSDFQKGITVLTVLSKLYPKDLLTQATLQTPNSFRSQLDLSCLAPQLHSLLQKLESGDTCVDSDFEQLINQLPGIADIYRYYALALLRVDKIERAATQLNNARNLPSLANPLKGIYFQQMNILLKLVAIKQEFPPQNDPICDLLQVLTELHHSDDEERLVCKFLDISSSLISESRECLLFVYFGLQHLVSHVPFVNHQETKDRCLNLLTKIGITYLECGGNDAWFLERFRRGESESTINLGELTFREHSESALAIELDDHLIPTQRCAQTVYLKIFRELFHFYQTQFCTLRDVKSIEGKFQDSIYLESPGVNLLCLVKWLQDPTPPRIERARLWLQNAPHKYSLRIHDWIKFALAQYTSVSLADKTLTSLQKALSNGPGDETRLTLISQHVREAHQRMSIRSEKHNQAKTVHHHDSLQYISSLAHQKFGWKENESLEDWSLRLRAERDKGQTSAGIRRYKEGVEPYLAKRDLKLLGDLGSSRVMSILNCCRDFWIEFCNVTLSKNRLIAESDLEDGESAQQSEWYRLERADWLKVIKSKEGAKAHCAYSRFTPSQQDQLEEILREKKQHEDEVKALRKPSRSGSAINLVSALIENIEHKRESGVSHSIYLSSKQEAETVYRLALEVSYQRLVDHFFLNLGPKKGSMKDVEALVLELKTYIIGAFHGPESHLFGKGPLQKHFNAGIIPSSGESAYKTAINTHIYFPNG